MLENRKPSEGSITAVLLRALEVRGKRLRN
jgi:hypothetical protein